MPHRFIDADFQRDVPLADGTVVRLRLLRPSDREKLQEGMRRLSPHSRYLRFLSAQRDLSDEALRYLTETDNENHLAIAAGTATDDEQGIGVARFVRQKPGARIAEAAITVDDAYQGRGLGRLLLAALTLAARERGVEGFHAEILRSNVAILTLLKHLGASLNDAGSDDEVHVDLPLPPLPADGDFSRLPDGAGAQLLRFAASELHLLGKRK